MKHREGTGSLKCRMCDASFQMPIHHLHEPIDVFSEWLDECEAAEKKNSGGGGGSFGVSGRGVGGMSGGNNNINFDSDDDDDDDDLGEASGLGKQQDTSTANNQTLQNQYSLNSLGVEDSDDDSD